MIENIPAKPAKALSSEANTWAMILHLSQLACYVVPVAGIAAPIVIWQLKKAELPDIDAHGKNVANWLLTALVAICISIALVFFIVGIPLIVALSIGLPVVHVIFVIIGAVKASNGECWEYPMTWIKAL